MNNIKIALLGGDVRQISTARRLCEEYTNVCMWGINRGDGETGDCIACRSYEEALDGADVIVLPLPASVDGRTVSCPMMPELPPLPLEKLIDGKIYKEKKPIILGGKLSPAFKCKAKDAGFLAIDYYENELLQIRNALPTAEGALEIAMNESKKTIRSSRIAVVGYGRIAKALSKMLLAMRSNVTVAARKPADLAYAEIDGCDTLRINYIDERCSLMDLCSGYDVIFNTVPYWVFDRETIENMDKKTLIIDLASAPGGFDINALKENNVEIIRANSLPGKCAPITAGGIIGDTIIEIIRAEGLAI